MRQPPKMCPIPKMCLFPPMSHRMHRYPWHHSAQSSRTHLHQTNQTQYRLPQVHRSPPYRTRRCCARPHLCSERSGRYCRLLRSPGRSGPWCRTLLSAGRYPLSAGRYHGRQWMHQPPCQSPQVRRRNCSANHGTDHSHRIAAPHHHHPAVPVPPAVLPGHRLHCHCPPCPRRWMSRMHSDRRCPSAPAQAPDLPARSSGSASVPA